MAKQNGKSNSQAIAVPEPQREAGIPGPKRVELVWEGKRGEVDRIALPFQRIEIVNESRATREAERDTLFRQVKPSSESSATTWRNKLIWGDNKYVLGSLRDEFAGKIDLIYIDPPFATGSDFSFSIKVGGQQFEKEPSLIEEKAYRDTWGRGLSSYYQMLYDRLVLMRELLSDRGTIYIHLGKSVASGVRLICDEIFGSENVVNEITWKRSHAHGDTGQGAKHFGPVTETILVYAKSGSQIWESQYVPYTEEIIERDYKYIDAKTKERYRLMPVDGPGGAAKGNPYYEFLGVKGYWRYSKETMQELHKKGEVILSSTGKSLSRKRFLKDAKGTPVTDLWDDVDRISPTSLERVDYPTQKPACLIERVLSASTDEGSLVADFFCGSGTLGAVAERMKRRWLLCDLSRWAIQVTRKRFLDIEGCQPFEVLNLGQYERQYWQGLTFGKSKSQAQTPLHEYVKFILELYKAEPVIGLGHIHGQRAGRMVHIGAADAPVTLTEIRAALGECAKIKQSKLDILGWEWEMGLHDVVEAESRKTGVQLRLLHVPREAMDRRAVDAGDVRFYELAHLEVAPEAKGKSFRIKLENFVIPSPDLIPEDVRSKIGKWSDYIDYWAVDFDYNDDVFHNQWQDYRTRSKRDLALVSDWHDYAKAGEHKILVKVFDIFGNDTTHLIEVKTR